MPKRAWKTAAVLSLLAAMLSTTFAPTASSAPMRRSAASLTITPGEHYVGGQGLVFAGNIGATGSRRVHLQLNASYSGGVWGDVDGFSAPTEADGDFHFVYPAPAMFGIRYRVASGSLATPYVTFDAHSQDLTVTPVGVPQPGVPFDLLVDTTPTLARRPDTIGLQPFPGRTLVLQERVSPTEWQNLATTEVGTLGLATFTVTEPDAGGHVYRVKARRIFEDGNRIGWFPSFPTYVQVGGGSSSDASGGSGSTTGSTGAGGDTDTTEVPAPRTPSSGDRTTASQTYKWGVSLFDFAWVFGESLGQRPYRGSVRKGRWSEYNDGAGRVSSHNGGLFFDSKRENKPGPGDFGTTMATMRGNAMAYGRWEVRIRARSDDTDGQDYVVRAELVPADADRYDCGAHNITLGEMSAHGRSILVGVNAGDQRWSLRQGVADGINNVHYNLAVEVTKQHITWFLNGSPIATADSAKAVSDLPLTLRLSLVGEGRQEMNDTEILSDWQRGFSLLRGTQVDSGHRMDVDSYQPGC